MSFSCSINALKEIMIACDLLLDSQAILMLLWKSEMGEMKRSVIQIISESRR